MTDAQRRRKANKPSDRQRPPSFGGETLVVEPSTKPGARDGQIRHVPLWSAACLVLKTAGATAFWITSWPFAEYVKHAWPGAWICSAFRNEARDLHQSSDLIREAVAVTRHFYGNPPTLGMVTFVDPNKTRRKRDPGRCFRRAGFVPATPRTTKGGLVALQLWPVDMPPAEPCIGMMAALDFAMGEAQAARRGRG